jgi:hypothetical protein
MTERTRHADDLRNDHTPSSAEPAPPTVAPGPAAVLALQRSAGNEAVARVLGSYSDRPVDLGATGDGRPLEEPTRERLEPALGQDLSDVRVHEDGQAERASSLALAAGPDIHFARGRYRPSTPDGFDLIAHEIAHVAQQRAGRVPATSGRLVSDPALEGEADAFADHARTASPGRVAARSARAAQPMPAPAVGIGAILATVASETAVNLVTVLGAVGGTIAGTYIGMQPGQNGFASMLFPQKMLSGQDTVKLQEIAQFEIINRYVERYLRKQKDEGKPQTAPEAAPEAEGRGERDDPTGTPTGEQIDEQVLNQVANATQRSLQEQLETNLATAEREFMWSEDDTRRNANKIGGTAGSSDAVGVTGYLQFRNMQGRALRQTLALSDEARKLVGKVPGDGREVIVHLFWGGMVSGDATESMWQSLTVNVEGGAAQESVADGGSPLLIVRTVWNWDRWGKNTESRMENKIALTDQYGLPVITGEYEGSAEG